MSIEEQYPAQYAQMAHLTGTDLIGDLVNQRVIFDTMTQQVPPANPVDDTKSIREHIDGTSEGVDLTWDTQTVDPRRILQGTIEARKGTQEGVTAGDVAKLLREELRSYQAMPFRMEIPTVTATVRMYLPAPSGGVAAFPQQLLSVDTNRYRILIDAYADSAGTFRIFMGQTASDALPGSGFRFDSSQSHPIQIHWGSDLWVAADPANTVGGYINLIVERYR